MSRVVKGNSRLIFRPKNNPPAHNSNTTTTTTQDSNQSANEPTHHTTQLSPAQKMKLKAQAAKAARAALKSNSRATSIATDMEPSTHSPSSTARKPAPDPPIDPLLDSLTSSHPAADHHPFQHDIPVPDNTLSNTPNPSPTSTLTQSPQSVAATHQPFPIPTSSTTTTTSSQKAKSIPKKKLTKKTIPEEAPDEHDDDISPRLKRKRHLEQLRKNKKNKSNHNQGESSQVSQTNDRVHQKSITKLKARARKPTSSARAKKGSKGKNASVGDENGRGVVEGRAGPDGGEEEEEEEEEEEPLDPTKVSMAELTNPHLSKGQTSELLEKRVEMIMERLEREKKERMAAREEKKRQAKLVLINRAQSVKARRKLRLDDHVQKEADDEQLAAASDEEMADGHGDHDHDEDDHDHDDHDGGQQQQQDNEKEAASRKQKIMQEYGLEDIDSDDDLADFEEVEYDEFARKQKTSTTAVSSSTAAAAAAGTSAKMSKKKAAVPHQQEEEEEEEEEVEVEEFNVDDYVPQASQYAPQLRVVDGQMVLDQDSLEVNRRDQSPSQLDEMEVVEESDTTRLVNSNTWSKAVRGERWTADETGLFYDAVRLFGSDFEMISQLFPGRTRRQIRLKWNKEEKISPDEITRALLGKKPAPVAAAGEDGELERISEASDERSDRAAAAAADDDNNKNENEDGEDEEEATTTTEAGEEMDVEGLVMPTQLRTFRQYARIVGIDATGPIPEDPMDKWREKERLELEMLDRAGGQLKKSAPDDGDADVDPDAQEEEVAELVEHDFAGWGELDDD